MTDEVWYAVVFPLTIQSTLQLKFSYRCSCQLHYWSPNQSLTSILSFPPSCCLIYPITPLAMVLFDELGLYFSCFCSIGLNSSLCLSKSLTVSNLCPEMFFRSGFNPVYNLDLSISMLSSFETMLFSKAVPSISANLQDHDVTSSSCSCFTLQNQAKRVFSIQQTVNTIKFGQ